ncbi:aminoglycoside 6-adenylyltransferase [Fredinandcohnia sp. QZ13]|uniref:aminoglycoside 6-adenylyltransferase n=1 Tax=Fredinandcohnia sp. QZ13 TaxID=3073144 RepID=UPI002853610A|nr:aminoglycoside 6-adenylyltransferase [Fredinandcohnia sp. QZ13]MDR4886132.1 aminoglycoside 6-adenylyltransferase [Fredinandcohnia sp. QZ13]
MRTEQEMMDIILGIARNDERIRAVYMNGSRTNQNVPKDIFQDYDIVYVVSETESFIKEENWIRVFGELIMLQEPDKNNQTWGGQVDVYPSYGYLMLFKDGNRIDLHIETKENMLLEYQNDKLTVPLLDKDDILPCISAPTDLDYHVKKPTELSYLSTCNDFWWCLQNVAKGIWRHELPYAKQMFELVIRPHLDQMVSWWIGCETNFQVSVGKMGKYFKNHLPDTYWQQYERTYSDHNYDNFWNSIFVTCELFRSLAREVAENLRFVYPIKDDRNMTAYLIHVRNLPKDAKKIY